MQGFQASDICSAEIRRQSQFHQPKAYCGFDSFMAYLSCSLRILLMFGETHSFVRGTVYRIINRKTGRCLSASFHDLTTLISQDMPDQMWIIADIKNDQFEIVQMRSGEVLSSTEGRHEVKMEKGRLKNTQMWTFELAEKIKEVTYYWIRPARNPALVLSASAMSEKVKVSSIDQTLHICLWEFLPCPETSSVFRELSAFHSDFSKLVLEVPEHSHKEGTALVQYRYSGCGNQRWIIEVYEGQSDKEKEFIIKNYCTGLYLTASFSKMGFKATEALFNCGPDQRWRILPTKDGKYMLQSVSNDHFYLGVQNDKGGSLVTMTHELDKAKWTIEGYRPAVQLQSGRR